MKILVTGANGFVGKNLMVRLAEPKEHQILKFLRGDSEADLSEKLAQADVVFHLAGENRPADEAAFNEVNLGLTQRIADYVGKSGRKIPILFSSSTQADLDNPYGRSKRAAESCLTDLAATQDNPVAIFRMPGVFGKWCRPNYNSVVATFCHSIARGLPVQVSDPARELTLSYIDDVVEDMLGWLDGGPSGLKSLQPRRSYTISLGDLLERIQAYKAGRGNLQIHNVGVGLNRALYATFVSYLPVENFSYAVPIHGDARGVFVEMLKTQEAGQFSFFSAHPGVTRGGHYHHTKSEKFLVIKGRARIGFHHLISDESHFIDVCGTEPRIVDTIPGWVHDITNVGDEEMFALVWANEVFDRNRPDTVASKV